MLSSTNISIILSQHTFQFPNDLCQSKENAKESAKENGTWSVLTEVSLS